MSEAFQVPCPKCKAKLKIRSRAAAGKRATCPKCQHAFVVKLPAEEEDDELSFMNVEEPDEIEEPDEEEEEQEEVDERPRSRSRAGSRKAGGKAAGKKKGKSKPLNWQGPALIGGVVLLALGFVGGAGYLAYSLFLGGDPNNKIDTVYLNPETEVFVQVRIADLWQAPFAQSVINTPALKPQIDMAMAAMTKEFSMGITDLESITYGFHGNLNSPAGMFGAPMGGGMPPGGGMPGAGMPGAGMPGGGMPMGGMPGGGMGPGGPAGMAGGGAPPFVAVMRTKIPMTDAQRAGGAQTQSVDYQGKRYYKLSQPGSAGMAVFSPDANRIVVGPETEIKRIFDNGKNRARRADLDFVTPDKHIVIAYVPKDRTKFDQLFNNPAFAGAGGMPGGGGAPGGMPMGGGMPTGNGMPNPETSRFAPQGGMPMGGGPGMMPGMPGGGPPGGAGGSQLAQLAKGKVAGAQFSIHLTQDIEMGGMFSCTDADAAKAIGDELAKNLQQAKTQFSQQKSNIQMAATMFSAGEFIPILDQLVNSLSGKSDGTTASVELKIPGSIKTAIENFANSEFVKTLAQGGAAGGGNPLDMLKSLGGNPFGGGMPFGGPPANPQANGAEDSDDFGTSPAEGAPAGSPQGGTPPQGFGPPGGTPGGEAGPQGGIRRSAPGGPGSPPGAAPGGSGPPQSGAATLPPISP